MDKNKQITALENQYKMQLELQAKKIKELEQEILERDALIKTMGDKIAERLENPPNKIIGLYEEND